MSSNPIYMTVGGVKIPKFFSREMFQSALDFKPKPGEIMICTYPKCGTTWMQNIVINILRKGEPLEKPKDFFLASPFLEQLGAEDAEKMMIRPGAFKTHLPLDKLHWSPDVKYIYVARHPKDCCLSYFNHMKQLTIYLFEGSLDECVDMFVEGELEFGCYFDHLIPWYNRRNEPNVFFTTYEELLEDTKSVVLRLIEFIGTNEQKFFEENPDALDKILYNCSLPVMKTFINQAMTSMYDASSKNLLNDDTIPKGRKHIINYFWSLPEREHVPVNFIQHGKAGRWRAELTEAQNKKIDQMIIRKSGDSDVMSLWKNK